MYLLAGSSKLGIKNSEHLLAMLEDQAIIDDEEVFSQLPSNTCISLVMKEPNGTSNTACPLPLAPMQFTNRKQKRLIISEGNLGLRMPLDSVSKLYACRISSFSTFHDSKCANFYVCF